MRNRLKLFTLAFVLLSMSSVALAQEKMLTIDELFDPSPAKRVNFSGSVPNPRWLKDGKSYLVAGDPTKPGTPRLVRVNALTGESAAFFDAAKMEAALNALPGMSGEDARRLANRTNYQLNPAQTGTLLNHANDLFYYEFGSDRAWRLTVSASP